MNDIKEQQTEIKWRITALAFKEGYHAILARRARIEINKLYAEYDALSIVYFCQHGKFPGE